MSSERPIRDPHTWLALWPLYLLLLEYLAISLRFDAKPLGSVIGHGHALGYLGILAPCLFVMATVTYVIGGRPLQAAIRRQLRTARRASTTRALALSVNLLCYLGLWWQTSALITLAQRGQAPGWAALLGFMGAAAVSGMALLFALFPPQATAQPVKTLGRALCLGVIAGACAFVAGMASELLWQSLQTATLQLVLVYMWPFSTAILVDPGEAIIGTEDFVVQVAPECSGLEGIGLISVVMAAYLWSARAQARLSRALWLLPLAITLVFFGNALRIAVLIGVGASGYPDVALSGFHSKAGWLLFCAIALSLIAWAQRAPYFAREPQARAQRSATPTPVAAHLMPQLALIATALVTGLFSHGLDGYYGLRVIAVFAALYAQRRSLPRLSWPASWHAPVIGLLALGSWLWLAPRPSAHDIADFKGQIAALGTPWSTLWLMLRLLGACVAVPIAEELAFRGFLLRRVIAANFDAVDKMRVTPLALVVSSAAFAALHPHAQHASLVAGFAYAFAQRARGLTADAIVAHAVTNLGLALCVLVGDAYWLWV